MKSDWKTVRLGDVGKVVTGKTPSTKVDEWWGGDVSFVTPGDLQQDKHITNTERHITTAGLSSINSSRLPPGAICVSCIGVLGYVGITTKECASNQQINSVIPSCEYDNDFVYYALRHLWPKFKLYEGTSSVVSILNKSTFSEFEISVPPLPIQRKIAAVLGSIDDKIENNRKICANLEAQAQAIFKSWFVDFEPFGGKMPQGWKMGKLGDVCKIFDSRRIPLSSLQRAEMQGDIPYYGATSIVDYVNDFLLEGIYLLMGEDGSVITDKGYPFLQYIWGKFWPNNHAHVLQGTNGYTTEMLYCLLSQTKVERYVTGAVQPKISQGNMIMIPACIPEGSDAKKFSGMIQPLFDELRCITDESRALAATRDALLPKLMSGEIDVEKVKVA